MILFTTILSAAAILAATAPSVRGLTTPNISLATLPIGYFGGLTVHPRPHANLAMLSKLRVVMIEKWEGHCWADCVQNTSVGLPCRSSCNAEREMMATMKAVKALNPAVAVGYYQNSLYDWTMQLMNAQFAAIDGNMRDSKGSLIGIEQDNGLKNQQIFALNHPDVVDLYLENQRNLSTLGFIDGSYLDKPTVFPLYNLRGKERWSICEVPSGPGSHKFANACADITAEQAANYTRGKNRLLDAVRKIWKPKGGYTLGVANSTLKLLHCNPKAKDSVFRATVSEFNKSITKAFADPFADSVFICVGDQTWTHDPSDTAGLCNETIVAKIMMTLRPGVIIGCNGWRPMFENPLGKPVGPATLDSETLIWTRTFASGTYAKYHENSKIGRIFWPSDE